MVIILRFDLEFLGKPLVGLDWVLCENYLGIVGGYLILHRPRVIILQAGTH